ncbi:hypothetical protein OMAG_002969 [Candidatus Omnitrophus magneticus]|uniref:Uncharacterized protein n=1 Tax=Candidatus Omnitrophus magneticus TaxID=1609969 RepID=A0A0F0CMC9_9BACT|nr:hypothetical protein OMAG_002969 [Candidatus Omnitrophus magneticus]
MEPLKFRATAKHSPATMSSMGVAICCRCIMSDLANTLHLPAIRGGALDAAARSLNPSRVSLRRSACWSRNEPVPAAHTAFIEKSFIPFFSSSMISFESSPPISITVFTWGKRTFTA